MNAQILHAARPDNQNVDLLHVRWAAGGAKRFMRAGPWLIFAGSLLERVLVLPLSRFARVLFAGAGRAFFTSFRSLLAACVCWCSPSGLPSFRDPV